MVARIGLGSSISIRTAEPADEPALAALEWSSPDAGALGLRVRMRGGYLALAGRYRSARGFVAVDGSDRILGMIFSSIAPTRCADRIVGGVYLYSLRVHPVARRRGVGTALVRHAWDDARRCAGVEIGFAGIMEGNAASEATFGRAGFHRYRDLAVRIVPRPFVGWRDVERRPSGLVVRRGREGDLEPLSAALEAAHAGHQLWRSLDADVLRQELEVAGHTLDDLWVALDAAGRIRAAGAVFDVGRVADVRVGGLPGLPNVLRPALGRMLARVPIRSLLFRHALLGEATPYLVRRVLRAYGGTTTALSIVVDPRDPSWPAVRSLPGLSGRVSVAVRGANQLDQHAPLAFA
jgi:ribosomal protein S18 acetylase RimI-like enzyme